MKNKTILFVIMILAVSLTSAYAGNENRIGTAGAQELLIPVGSRGTALGGAAIANSSGVDAIYWNPAGLANLHEGTEAMFSHLPYIADIDVEYAALGIAIEDFGKIGVSVKVVSIGDMEETTSEFPDGTGRIFSPTLSVIGLTFAKNLTTNINFGVTGNLIREDIFEVQATGLAFDFGFTYETQVRDRTLQLGFVMKNYGPDMQFEGRGFDRIAADEGRPVSSRNAGFELPTSFNLGFAYNFVESDLNSLSLNGNFRGNNQAQDQWQGGFEYGYQDRYFLRGGYNHASQNGDGDADETNDWIYGATFGGGVKLPVGESSVTLEYTWMDTDVFDANQFFTVKFAF